MFRGQRNQIPYMVYVFWNWPRTKYEGLVGQIWATGHHLRTPVLVLCIRFCLSTTLTISLLFLVYTGDQKHPSYGSPPHGRPSNSSSGTTTSGTSLAAFSSSSSLPSLLSFYTASQVKWPERSLEIKQIQSRDFSSSMHIACAGCHFIFSAIRYLTFCTHGFNSINSAKEHFNL